MQIRVVSGSGVPIYRQIADQIARGVANEEWAVGQSVPSVRGLARELVINPNTVAKAYADLVESGILETQAGRGFYVAKRRQVYTKSERMRRLDEAIETIINLSISLGVPQNEVIERCKELFSRNLKSVDG
jgi:GntR family transcriptional regulator